MTRVTLDIELKDPNRLCGSPWDQRLGVIRRDVQLEPTYPPTIRQPCCHNSLAPSDIHLTSFQKRDLTTAQRQDRALRKMDGCTHSAAHQLWIKMMRTIMTTHDVDQWHHFPLITNAALEACLENFPWIAFQSWLHGLGSIMDGNVFLQNSCVEDLISKVTIWRHGF